MFAKALAGAAFGAAALVATSASAVTFSIDDTFASADMTVTPTIVDETLTVDFSWTSSGSIGFVDFTVSDVEATVRLLFTDYSGGVFSSLYSLDVLDINGNATQRLTNQLSCFVKGTLAGNCNALTGDPDSGSSPSLEDALFELTEGSYRLGFVEKDRPAVGTASFEVSAVPLPAGIVLLLGGLAALGFVSRRNADAA